jgi:ABC-type glutathione transport system ATPase component
MSVEPLLEARGLTVAFEGRPVLNQVSLSVARDEVVGVVGETGAGKSVLARALIGLPPEGAQVVEGEGLFEGRPLSQMTPAQLRTLRGGGVALIGTDAKALLDPVRPVGEQVADVLRAHRAVSRAAAREAAIDLFGRIGIVDPAGRARAYPHQLSGGMAQRIVIAMALIAGPKVVLADDATLGLDATIQVQVLDLLVSRCREMGLGALLITHDLGIVARYCDRVAIMREGRIVEQGPAARFLERPADPYGAELLAAARVRPALPPALSAGPTTAPKRPLLEVSGLVKHFRSPAGEVVRAVDGVSFTVARGETLALVGESGSGKTTVGQCLLRLTPVDGGAIVFDGHDVTGTSEQSFRRLRRRIQMVFQEPYVALNPRWRVRDLIAEPLALDPTASDAAARRTRVAEMLERVRLPSRLADAWPHELTAGEQKRVGIARALATRPEFVVFDEPTTALDIRVRAQIIDLVRTLQQEMNLSALFITHDLNSVRSLAHRVAVMRRGLIVEAGETAQVFASPREDYTRLLLGAELPIETAASHPVTSQERRLV